MAAGFRKSPINGEGAKVQVFAQRVRELGKDKSPFLAPARERLLRTKMAEKIKASLQSSLCARIASELTGGQTPAQRLKASLKVGQIKGVPVYLEPVVMGQHIYHAEITAADWAFLAQAIKHVKPQGRAGGKYFSYFYADKRYRVGLVELDAKQPQKRRWVVTTIFIDERVLK